MQKKIFLQKGSTRTSSGGQSYLKYMLWAALLFILLVVVTPLFTRHSGTRSSSSRPSTDKGMVVREIPKTPESVPFNSPPEEKPAAEPKPDTRTELASAPPVPGTAPVEATAPTAEAPAAEANPEFRPLPSKPEPPAQSATEAMTGQLSSSQAMTALDTGASTAPKPAPAPKAAPAPVAAKPADSAAAAAKKQTPTNLAMAKPAPGSQPDAPAAVSKPSGGRFSVQVGSFKERQNAEEMQQTLKRRGYDVVIRPYTHPKLGQLYVVQLQPVESESKASTLMVQIQNEEKVKPMIVRVPATE